MRLLTTRSNESTKKYCTRNQLSFQLECVELFIPEKWNLVRRFQRKVAFSVLIPHLLNAFKFHF